MKKSIFFIIILIIVISLGVFFWLYEKKEVNQSEIVIYGNVDIRQVDMGFRVFGRVQNLLYDEGDHVTEGQLLAVLDKVPYDEKVSEARADLVSKEASFANALAKFKKRDDVVPAAISQEEYDDSFYNLEMMRGNLDMAKAMLSIAMTNYQDTEMLSYTSGVIITRIKEPGSIVNPGDPVFTISIDNPLWVRTYVSEPNLGKIYFGMKAEVTTDLHPLKTFHGHIGFISPVAEFTPKNVETTELRTDLVYRLRVIVDDPTHELKQGMPVTVKLKLDNSKG
jgi:HlyD family secretion protein